MSSKRRRRAPEPVLKIASRLAPEVLPALPPTAKRLGSWGRSIVVDGNTLDPTLQAFVTSLRALGITGMVSDDDVELSRRLMRDLCVKLGGEVPVEVIDLTIPGPAAAITVRRYLPPDRGDGSALVYFHGGGYCLGDLESYAGLCAALCRDAGTQVLSVDYRLAPEHPAPAALDDSLAAFRWIVAHAEGLGLDPGRIAVGGDSAGGALAAAVAQHTREDALRPALQVLLYPWVGITAGGRSRALFASGLILTDADLTWFAERYLHGSALSADDPRVSPACAGDLAGLPPALVVTAGFDPLRDQGNEYAAALAGAGTVVDLREMGSMTHGFMNFNGLGGEVAADIATVISAVRAHLRRG